ncbi:MAG: pentapeptide repeat-containing protein [Elainellaceae cyanobacterium]
MLMPMRRLLGLVILGTIALMTVGLIAGNTWLSRVGTIATLLLSIWGLWISVRSETWSPLSRRQWQSFIAWLGAIVAGIGLIQLSPFSQTLQLWLRQLDWVRVGTLGQVLGALGQILIAVLAVYIAWEQYVASKELAIQSNTITQQQTLDTYFEGIAKLMLDEHGYLEDFPMERAISEGRTAAILSSLDAEGKASILRFLSCAGLLTPLLRDRRLGRAIMDGRGGYAEDRISGLRVIDLGVMLAGADLSETDLRWTDLSDINMIRANLSSSDLAGANLSRTILYEASLANASLLGTRLFYGSLETTSPRTPADFPDYETGAFSGAVVENANFTGVKRLSEAQRYYCCAWGGSKTRKTIPGGCDDIPNLLER